jgi:hypothetical protein
MPMSASAFRCRLSTDSAADTSIWLAGLNDCSEHIPTLGAIADDLREPASNR